MLARLEPTQRVRLAGLGAVVAGYLALYAPTAGYGFVWDDVSTLATNEFFDRPLLEVLRATEHGRMDETITAMRGVSLGHESYRPVNVATHWLDVRLFGRGPGPMHVHTMLWGLLGVLLAYALAAALLNDGWALVVAALFAIHPAHVEPFAYVSARADAVSGGFVLLAALLVVRASPPAPLSMPAPRWRVVLVAAACLALLCALFAKEAAVALPLAMLLLAFALGKTRAWAWALGLLALTVALHFPLRALLVPGAPLAAAGAGGLLARTPGIVLQYLQMFVAPLSISNARPPDFELLTPGWVVVCVAVVGIVLALVGARRVPSEDARRRDVGLVVAGLTWAALFVAPAGVAVATLGALADRYAYLPLFGFGLAVAVVLRRASVWRARPLARGAVLGVAGLWAATLLFVTYRERPFWRSNAALYHHAVAVEPSSPIAHYRLGVILGAEQRWPEAAAAFARSAELKRGPMSGFAPAIDRVLNNLGVAQLNLGQRAEAEGSFRRAISESNNVSFRAWFNLAKLLRERGDGAAACRALQEALAISPRYQLARADLETHCAGTPVSR